MKYSNDHSKWFLLLLAFSLLNQVASSGDEIKLNQKVIVVMENDKEVQKAGYFLFCKNKGISQVVMLNTDQEFKHVKWDYETETFVPNNDNLLVDWQETKIVVIGHGRSNTESQTIGTLLPEQLAEKINQLTSNSDVGKISIVGCLCSTPTQGAPPYLEKFWRSLGHTKTSVSIQSAVVSVDSNGNKLTGKLQVDLDERGKPTHGIEWSRKDASKKWIGEYNEKENEFAIKQTLATDEAKLKPYYYGILPKDEPIYVKPKDDSNKAYRIEDSFSWVDRIARDTYDKINNNNNNNDNNRGGNLIEKTVHILSNSAQEGLEVREINEIDDLLKELRYHGESGPGTDANAKEYYRFGDWVLGMRLDTFYVDVEGIIVTSTDSDGKKEQINDYTTTNWEEVPKSYGAMRKGIDEAKFIEKVRHWMNGEHGKIGLNRESAFHAQCGMAMFMSESIRCFHNHFTNMMSLQLIEKGYMNVDLLFKTHPMARGGT